MGGPGQAMEIDGIAKIKIQPEAQWPERLLTLPPPSGLSTGRLPEIVELLHGAAAVNLLRGQGDALGDPWS